MPQTLSFLNKLKNAWTKPISATGLGLFRIVYGIVLWAEVWQLFQFRHLIFDPIPFLQMAEFSFAWLLMCWLAAIVLLIIGWNTTLVSILNYGFTVVIIGGLTSFEYHLDYVITIVNFLLIFIPVGLCFSVDALFNKPPTQIVGVAPNLVNAGNYYMLILCGLALVYTDSIFWKASSPMWRNGLGLWLPASLPHISYLSIEWFLNQKWLVLSLGYLTFLFEGLFIFLFMAKKLRVSLLIIGLGLHLGISLAFPIPLFGWGAGSLFILMIPLKYIDTLWKWLSHKFSHLSRSKISNFFQAFSFSPIKQFNLPSQLVSGFIVLIIGLQTCLIINNSPALGLKEKRWAPLDKIYSLSTRLLGITSHPVFMDHHFQGYQDLISITYLDKNGNGQWLPILRPDGTPAEYLRGRVWVHWSWRVNGPNPNIEGVKNGIERFSAFWAKENHIDLQDTRFNIKIKRISVPDKWQANFIKRQKDKPWQDAGYADWKNEQIAFHLNMPE